VSADLWTERQTELEAARERPQEEGYAAAIRQIADLAGVPAEQAAKTLAAIEAQPGVTRELLMRRIAEVWLGGSGRLIEQIRVCSHNSHSVSLVIAARGQPVGH